MIRESAVVAAVAGAGPFEMGGERAHAVCYGTPLLGTHSTTLNSFLKSKNKEAFLFVCLFYYLQSFYQVASSKPTKEED